MKTETCKLHSIDFWIFLPNIIKIDRYNFELYHFKVGPFFLRHSVVTNATATAAGAVEAVFSFNSQLLWTASIKIASIVIVIQCRVKFGALQNLVQLKIIVTLMMVERKLNKPKLLVNYHLTLTKLSKNPRTCNTRILQCHRILIQFTFAQCCKCTFCRVPNFVLHCNQPWRSCE